MTDDTKCPYCGADYGDDTASDDYMYQGHVLFDCPNPDRMERAYLNASPVERSEVWHDSMPSENCRMRDCDNTPVYEYHNPFSGARGAYCLSCFTDLRDDVSVEEWLTGGFASPIES